MFGRHTQAHVSVTLPSMVIAIHPNDTGCPGNDSRGEVLRWSAARGRAVNLGPDSANPNPSRQAIRRPPGPHVLPGSTLTARQRRHEVPLLILELLDLSFLTFTATAIGLDDGAVI